jgi:hypothetical protein
LRRLETAYGELPETVESLTARGRHVWFRMPPDAGVRNSASRIARGIDVRGTGGYVLAPPSVHPSGRKYAWSVDSASAFAAAPPWLLQRIATPAAVAPRTAARITSSAEWQQLSGDSVGEGARNETLTRITGHLLRHYIDPLLALALVRAWNAAHCLPPLPESEVTRIVNSIASIEMRRRGRGDG